MSKPWCVDMPRGQKEPLTFSDEGHGLTLIFLVGAFSLKEKSPTLTVSSFFFQLTISLWVVHFSYNFCSSFVFVHLSSSTQPESVGSNPALNHKFFNEFFGIVRPKKYFFSKKKQNFFFEKIFFSKFFQ